MSKTVIYSNGSQNGGFDPGVGYSFFFLFYFVTNPVDQRKKKKVYTEFHTRCLSKKFTFLKNIFLFFQAAEIWSVETTVSFFLSNNKTGT